jgi:hypothetical protein
MPPTFLYLMALAFWVALAVVVWIVSIILMLLPGKRRKGFCIASAMAGTFPGVFTYQIIAAPIVIALLLTMQSFWKKIEPGTATTTENPAVIIMAMVTALISFVIVAGMSLTGFWEGWRAGWLLARGDGFRSALQSGPAARLIRLLGKCISRTGNK